MSTLNYELLWWQLKDVPPKNWMLRSSIEYFLSEKIKELLYNIVLELKDSDLISLAASNAITILNKSEFSFTNKDLSKIKIPSFGALSENLIF